MEEKLHYLALFPDVNIELLDKQVNIEEESFRYGLERFLKNNRSKDFTDTTAGYALIQKNYGAYLKSLYEWLHVPSKVKMERHADIKAHLRLVSIENLAYVAMRTILNLATTRVQWNSFSAFTHRIASAVREQYALEMFRKYEPNLIKRIEADQKIRASNAGHKRSVLFAAIKHHGIPLELNLTNVEEVKLGAELFYRLQESTGLVWSKTFMKEGRKELHFSFHPLVMEWVNDINRDLAEEEPLEMPMVIPPLPWTDLYDGGFLTNQIRKSNRLVKISYEKKLESYPPLPQVCDTVNKLQRVPWRINKFILNFFSEAMNGREYTDVAIPTLTDLPLPPKTWHEDIEEPTPDQLRIWKKQARDVYEANNKMRQDRIICSRRLFIANKFKDFDKIYFCWTLDWRGRAYPVQSFVNPQGDDISKSLLEFAEGKPVTPDGLFWLRVHGANCYGVDKVSFDDRVKWVEANRLAIEASADDPHGERFWRDADDPFQFLAFCKEYRDYLKDPEGFRSHLPVFMDGSCNGLQHLSAMLRDGVGGHSVNLVPTDKPRDVYSDVLAQVIAKVEADARQGHPSACLWQGKVDRKMVKRGVMTTPYGVTSYGLQDQIQAELLKRGRNYLKDPKENRNTHAAYLSICLREGLKKSLVKACEAMEYLRYLAGAMCEAGHDMQWLTPNGFFVQQDYMVTEGQVKHINTFGKSIVINLRRGTTKLSKARQMQGIVPNFVHSFDAAHMMNTIKAMPEGTSLGMIHDSYGTHCSDVPMLHRVLRGEFIKLYSGESPLNYLWRICKERSGLDLVPPPPVGDLDLTLVASSKYFFS